MARTKKDELKQKEPGLPQHISVEDFMRIRDAVVTGLSTLQSAVSDLSSAYLNNVNAVLGRGIGANLDQIVFPGPPADNGFFARGPTPAPMGIADGVPETKKRKRAPHDKNAPKRALTPFFLFLQTARPVIAEEMGPGHTAKEVQDEGGRRWREMPEHEKFHWTEQYGYNFARYKEHSKAYKAGLPIPEISDAHAKRLYEDNKKTGKALPPAVHTTTMTHAPADSDTSDEETSDEDAAAAPMPTPIKANASGAPAAKKPKTASSASNNAMLNNGSTGNKKKAPTAPMESDPVLDPALMATDHAMAAAAAANKKKPSSKKATKAAEDAAAAMAADMQKRAALDPMNAAGTPKGEKPKKKKPRKSGVPEA